MFESIPDPLDVKGNVCNFLVKKVRANHPGDNIMPGKNVPRRRSKIAEEYAKKVRAEPPKASRQEDPLVAEGRITARQHNPDKKPSRRRSPF